MIIIKFGGTSVLNAKRIIGVSEIVSNLKKKHKKIGVLYLLSAALPTI